VPLANGTLTTYLTGTTTPSTTWQDAELTIANTNPIVLDARGECVVWLDSGVTYRFVLKNAQGVTLWTQDDISGVLGSGVFKAPVSEVQTATAGQTLFTLTTVTYEPGRGNLAVYQNGIKLIAGTDYSETSTTSITLSVGTDLADELEFQAGGRLTSVASGVDVAYTYPGTGAVATTQGAAIDAMAATPEYWGAVGDGLTDDTAAFQAGHQLAAVLRRLAHGAGARGQALPHRRHPDQPPARSSSRAKGT
jgi:hypothetical protein